MLRIEERFFAGESTLKIFITGNTFFNLLARGAWTVSIVASAVLVGLQRNLFYSMISHRSSAVPWVLRNRRNIVPVLPVGKRHKAR